MTVQQMELGIRSLTISERLYLMRRLLESLEKSDKMIEEIPAEHAAQDEELTVEEIYARFPWMGTAEALEPDASERVEEILLDEVDPQLGWKLK